MLEQAGGRGGGATCRDVTSAARSDPEGRGAEAEAGVASWRPKAGATRRLTVAGPGRKAAEALRLHASWTHRRTGHLVAFGLLPRSPCVLAQGASAVWF